MDFNPDLPGLLGSEALMQYLQDGLQQIEAGQGFADAEARGLLLQLQQQTNIIQTLAGRQQQDPQLTDLQLAEQIDSLDAQLAQMEAALGSADEATKQLLGQSTSKWIVADSPGMHSAQQQVSRRELPAACQNDDSLEGQGSDAKAGERPTEGSNEGDSEHQRPHSNSSRERSSYSASITDADEGAALLVATAAAAAAAAAAAPEAVGQSST